jgi:hypothetical protein
MASLLLAPVLSLLISTYVSVAAVVLFLQLKDFGVQLYEVQ